MPCPFCERNEQMQKGVFYDDGRWFALLAAPYHTKGHTILAVKKRGTICPNKLKREVLFGLNTALTNAARVLQRHYKHKDVLFASLRGDIAHFHWHLIPLWEEEERKWRKNNNYEKGHLLEFLGFLEKEGDSRAKSERKAKNLSGEEQRVIISEILRPDIEELRKLTRYKVS